MARFGVGGVSVASPTIAIDRVNSLVTVNSRVTVQTLFGAFAGAPTIAFDKSSTTNYQLAKLEVVLALDITGSMNQIPVGDTVSKLTTLKLVATDVVTSLYNQAVTESNIRIGIVPWSNSVNVPSLFHVTGTKRDGRVFQDLRQRLGSHSRADQSSADPPQPPFSRWRHAFVDRLRSRCAKAPY